MAKRPHLVGTQTSGGGSKSTASNYITNFGRDLVISMLPNMTKVTDKWQGYLLENYKLYWSHIWDHAHSSKEAAFVCSIWHKAVTINE